MAGNQGAMLDTTKPTKPERWIPWNPSFIVTLKKIHNPTAMYAKRAECIRVPIDQPVGFDFEVGECVAPYEVTPLSWTGKGFDPQR